jgi:hypothetical protein
MNSRRALNLRFLHETEFSMLRVWLGELTKEAELTNLLH